MRRFETRFDLWAAAATVVLAGAGQGRAIEVGQVAPDFTLFDVAGNPHTLANLRGNLVLLAFIGYG